MTGGYDREGIDKWVGVERDENKEMMRGTPGPWEDSVSPYHPPPSETEPQEVGGEVPGLSLRLQSVGYCEEHIWCSGAKSQAGGCCSSWAVETDSARAWKVKVSGFAHCLVGCPGLSRVEGALGPKHQEGRSAIN